MSDYSDKQRAKKRNPSAPTTIKDVVNSVTPGGYKMKRPAIFDFYEGEWDNRFKWAEIVSAGPLRVVWQATLGRHGRHGDDKPDRAVKQFVEGAKAHGIKYGLYHFLAPHNIFEQFEFYIENVSLLGGFGDMPPIVDVEYGPVGRNSFRGVQWGGQIKTWLDLVERASGQKPIIYTNPNFWSITFDRQGNPPVWTNDYLLWTAGYPWTPYVDRNVVCPRTYIPKGWRDAAIWQYAEDGRYRGFCANDLNLVSEWYALELGSHGP